MVWTGFCLQRDLPAARGQGCTRLRPTPQPGAGAGSASADGLRGPAAVPSPWGGSSGATPAPPGAVWAHFYNGPIFGGGVEVGGVGQGRVGGGNRDSCN